MDLSYISEDKEFAKVYHWIGTFVVCALAFPLHFIYNWTGELDAIGVLAPINESIWEHLKLVFWPLLLWWGIGYAMFHERKNLTLNKWLPAAGVSVFISMAFIVVWYYTWQGAFDIETELTNIGSLFIAVPIGQLIGIHIYRVVESRWIYVILSILFFIVFAGIFAWFTFNTPEFPIFIPAN